MMSDRGSRRVEDQTRIGGYFARLGELGGQIEATDRAARRIDLDDAIAQAVTMALAAKSRQGRVMFVGNGGSAGIASHMTTDWLKNGGFSALCFNDASQLTCLANDLGYERTFAVPVEQHGREGDLLIALSSSGQSPNILAAAAAARRIKADVITLTGFTADNPLRRQGDLNFWLPDGHYGFVEIGHLAICHAILDIAMGWQRAGDRPVASAGVYR
jgi:D-sedoheptulose 7-phosphate isomerase